MICIVYVRSAFFRHLSVLFFFHDTAPTEIYTLSLHDALPISLPRGAVYGLVGANGAGKTTLIRHVLGLLRAQSGSVRVFGVEDRKSTRLNSSHQIISYAVFCLKKKKTQYRTQSRWNMQTTRGR